MQGVNFDLSHCLVDFTTCPTNTKLVDYHSELSAFKEFTNQKDENIIKIAICTSDIDSPFLKIKDRDAMLRSVFDFLKIDLSVKKNKELFNSIFEYKNEAIAGCWAKYYQMQYNSQYTEWAMTKQTFDILTFELNRVQGESEKNLDYANRRVKITNDLKAVGKDLRAMEAELFPDTKQKKVIALHEVKIVSYPERYAQVATAI